MYLNFMFKLDAHVLDDHITKIIIGQALNVLKFLPVSIYLFSFKLNNYVQNIFYYYI